MADISLSRNHNYGIDDARARLERLLTNFQARKPDLIQKIEWAADRNSAEAGGKFFKGQFRIGASDVSVELELIGFAAKMAKPMVKDQLEKALGAEFPA